MDVIHFVVFHLHFVMNPASLSPSLSLFFFHFISSTLCMIASMQCNVIDCTVIETFFFMAKLNIRIIMKLTCKWKWNFKIQLSPSHCWKLRARLSQIIMRNCISCLWIVYQRICVENWWSKMHNNHIILINILVLCCCQRRNH